MKKMIFHYPGPFHTVLDSGEKKRPQMMLKAFQDLGYDTILMSGEYDERVQIFDKIEKEIASCDFIYSENSTLPLHLTNQRRFFKYNSVDIKLFRRGRQKSIPSGVFYRDLYWRYPAFSKNVGRIKHILSIPFYLLELLHYRKYADIVFVPNMEFAQKLPVIDPAKIVPLPPGCTPFYTAEQRQYPSCSPLKILTVGSVAPPIYDMTQLFNKVSTLSNVMLTVVTRQKEWEKWRSYYTINDNIKIVFASDQALQPLYSDADIFAICYTPDEYRKICMPLKLFESIGFALPVLSMGNTPVSNFIRENDIGWIADDTLSIIEKLACNPEDIIAKKENLKSAQTANSWIKRAEKAASCLVNSSSKYGSSLELVGKPEQSE